MSVHDPCAWVPPGVITRSDLVSMSPGIIWANNQAKLDIFSECLPLLAMHSSQFTAPYIHHLTFSQSCKELCEKRILPISGKDKDAHFKPTDVLNKPTKYNGRNPDYFPPLAHFLPLQTYLHWYPLIPLLPSWNTGQGYKAHLDLGPHHSTSSVQVPFMVYPALLK